MESLFCLFCARRNPGDARFCNECGTPLDMKPCRQCDAVNPRAAGRCYRCEAAMPTEASASGRDAPAESPAVVEDATPAAEVVAQAGNALAALARGWRADAPFSGNADDRSGVSADARDESAATALQDGSNAAVAHGVGEPSFESVASAPVHAAHDTASRASNVAIADAGSVAHGGEQEGRSDSTGAAVDQRGPHAGPRPGEPSQDVDDEVRWHVDAGRLPDVDLPPPATVREPNPYRPPRVRALAAVVVLLLVAGAAAAVYVARHPDALASMAADARSRWERARTPSTPDPAPPGAVAPTSSDSAAPTPSTSESAPQGVATVPDVAPPIDAAGKEDAAPATPVVVPPVTTAEPASSAGSTASHAATPRSSAAPAASPPVRAAAPPKQAASSSKSGARQRSETRGTAAPDRNSARLPRGAPPSEPARAPVQCTPAVAALGLC